MLNKETIANFFNYTITEEVETSRYGKVTVNRTNWSKIIKQGLSALATFILLVVLWPIHQVPTGHRGVFTLGGSIQGITGEGYKFVYPLQKLHVFSIRPEAAVVENAEGATSDTQPVKVSLTVRYNIMPDKVAEVFESYSHDGNLYSYVDTATREAFKAVTSRYTATDLIAKRADVSLAFRTAIQAKMATYYANIVSVDVTSFSFSDSYMAAINAKVTEEQKKLAADNRAKTVESEQRIKVVTAEAEATALKAKADGEAYATLKAAEANAKALKIQNDALAQNRDVLELKRIEVDLAKAQKWNGALPTHIYGSAPVPYLSVDTKK